LSARVDLVFTQLKDAHEQEIARLNREHKQREEVLNAREAIYRAFMGPSQELSSRQVGTMGSLISKRHKDGLSCTDAELIASAVECGFDADTAQRCLDQLKADGRYAMIFSEVES
jgi:hypothetical protein